MLEEARSADNYDIWPIINTAYNKQYEHALGPISGEASVLQEGELLRVKGLSTWINPLYVKEEVLARPRLSFCCPHDGWGFLNN